MIKFEINKIINMSFMIVMIFIIILDGCNIALNYKQYSDDYYDNGFSQIYNNVKGEITEEKVDYITKNKKHFDNLVNEGEYSTDFQENGTYTGYVFSDMLLFDQIYEEMYNCVNYQELAKSKTTVLNENIEKNKGEYSKKSDYIIEKLTNRSVDFYYHTNGIKSYLTYDVSFIFCIILSLFICSKLFLVDQPNHIRGIISSTPNGKNINLKNKIFSLSVIVVLLNVFFSLYDYIIFNQVTLIDGLLNPIYSIDYFKNSFLNCSIILFAMIIIISKIIINLFIVYCFFFMLSIIRKNFIAIIFSLYTGFVFVIGNLVKNLEFLFQPRKLYNSFYLIDIGDYIFNKGTLILFGFVILIIIYLMYWKSRGGVYETDYKKA